MVLPNFGEIPFAGLSCGLFDNCDILVSNSNLEQTEGLPILVVVRGRQRTDKKLSSAASSTTLVCVRPACQNEVMAPA